jgi:hypothetical protein
MEQVLCLQQEMKKAGWGGRIADIARHRRDRKSEKPHH